MNIKEEFLSRKIKVNCRTRKDAEDFLKLCYSWGLAWFNGVSPLDYIGWGYAEKTIYSYRYTSYHRQGITYGVIDECDSEEEYQKIIPYNKLMLVWNKNNKFKRM